MANVIIRGVTYTDIKTVSIQTANGTAVFFDTAEAETATVTPSDQTQVITPSAGALLSQVTVNPIPSDWGHISWNGSVLTVS